VPVAQAAPLSAGSAIVAASIPPESQLLIFVSIPSDLPKALFRFGMPRAIPFRNPEHRELLPSGLRLAASAAS
jgi:hypothetical protein